MAWTNHWLMVCTVLSTYIHTCDWSNYCNYNARNRSCNRPGNYNSWVNRGCGWTIQSGIQRFSTRFPRGPCFSFWLAGPLVPPLTFLRSVWLHHSHQLKGGNRKKTAFGVRLGTSWVILKLTATLTTAKWILIILWSLFSFKSKMKKEDITWQSWG